MNNRRTMERASFTPQQLAAIEGSGNLLVVAGAGTGKTRTLVGRCMRLIQEGESLESILMVTFTEAAAAEMRGRIRQALGELEAADPSNEHVVRQLALLDTARISTLHSFCLQLIREHFQELGLDPQFSVLDGRQTRPLMRATLDELLERHYSGSDRIALSVQSLVRAVGRGTDKPIRALVLKLHAYSQSLPDPAAWLDQEQRKFERTEPVEWREWFAEAVEDWCKEWGAVVAGFADHAPAARVCAEALNKFSKVRAKEYSATAGLQRERRDPAASTPPDLRALKRDESRAPGSGLSECDFAGQAGLLRAILAADSDEENWPHGTKGRVRKPLKHFFAEAAFLASLLPDEKANDPLAQDWNWIREHMIALVALTREFTAAFGRARRELAGLDFADLEQCALQLLRKPEIAEAWRARLSHVFVDEYQDINEAQDTIIKRLSRGAVEASSNELGRAAEHLSTVWHQLSANDQSRFASDATGKPGNRFLVGDVKQSIYRFRRANPKIFSRYDQQWSLSGEAEGRRIPLTENFRSREALLRFINPLFTALMRREAGGVNYEALQFGAPEERRLLLAKSGDEARVELHVIARANGENGADGHPEDEGKPIADLPAVEREARLLARRLRDLHDSKHAVWDEGEQAFRPVRWSDMTVLLRSPAGRAEAFAMEFNRAGIPLAAARDGFFESIEVLDLLNLLRLLDNPLQDVPLAAVLRSPLVGFSLDELVEVRTHSSAKPFWAALMSFHRSHLQQPAGGESASAANVPRSDNRESGTLSSAWHKADGFLSQFSRWRELVRQTSLSQCLETALTDTHYEPLLLAGERGEERVGNVRRFLDLARQFDPYQRQGLYRFLRFVESQEDDELDLPPASSPAADAVRLMSIHKSKGLEFPVVAIACLGTRFNEQDLSAPVLLQERYGLCPKITPPDIEQSYPSLAHWLARRSERRELCGEELRLLYVAMTRARDRLLLVGTSSRKADAVNWDEETEDNGDSEAPDTLDSAMGTSEILKARSHLDWLLAWLPRGTNSGDWQGERQGANDVLRWRIYEANDPVFGKLAGNHKAPAAEKAGFRESEAPDVLKARLDWRYPFLAATRETAKSSVSVLRRRHAEEEEEAKPLFRFHSKRARQTNRLTAAEIGSAHHLFLQFASLDAEALGDVVGVRREAQRMCEQSVLSAEQMAALDCAALAALWQSDLGKRILGQPGNVHREIPFTARLSPADLALCGLAIAVPSDEFIVVQGTADLAVILREEIWVVDFKTDDVRPGELAEKAALYAPQLRLYALALSRIYRRPVTERCLYFLAQRSRFDVSDFAKP